MREPAQTVSCMVAVIWIDWYAYHVARFRGLLENPTLAGKVRGIELVGGIGVHQGLKFREELPADLPVETLMPESSWREAGQWPLALKVWACLSRLDPEVVLVPGYYTLPAIAAALWAKLHGRTSVLMTESTAGDHTRMWWKESLKGGLVRTLFDSAVCGGQAHRRYLDQLGFPPECVMGSYDVVDNSFIEQAVGTLREQAAKPHDLPNRYFLYVGRLAPEKNIESLLREWTSYREAGGSWPLVLVGDGASAEGLRSAVAASLYASDVHFAGHKGYLDLALYYAFAACFVLPSTREPWGLVVNEAMAAGLPVIVSDRCGCAADLVKPNQNGFLFDPHRSGSLAVCLMEMELAGDSLRESMGNTSRTVISNYSIQTFGSEIARITK